MLKQIWKEGWVILGLGLLLSIFIVAYVLDGEHSQEPDPPTRREYIGE